MKLQVTQENLAKALSNVARIAMSSKNPLPILNNVLIKTVDNRLSIICYQPRDSYNRKDRF